jgi:hypothetical protein
MRVSIKTSDGQVNTYEGQLRVADSGVLSITPDEGGGNRILLSPAGWLSVEVIDAPPGIHLA